MEICTRTAMPSPKHPQKKAPNAKKAPKALAKAVRPDQVLAAIVGPEPLPRTELTKRIWAYIRAHKLQDTQDRCRIQADDQLRALFDGQDSVTMFELTKFVNRHLA
jgi:upstream activation factor subunit UAF30